MNVVFRVDSSIAIGTGHLMRCMTLAKGLLKRGFNIWFIMQDVEGNLKNIVDKEGFAVLLIEEQTPFSQQRDAELTKNLLFKLSVDIEWLIVDHYDLDYKWELELKKVVRKIFVIDDLANRQHHCDVLLDYNFHFNMNERYRGLLPSSTIALLGPKFILLRDEFYQYKKETAKHTGEIQRILVFYGGSDPTNETEKAVRAIQLIKEQENVDLIVDVVVGSANPWRETIETYCHRKQMNFYYQIDFLAQLMIRADLALGAGGITMWERCYLGLPSVVTIVAENQLVSTEAAARMGAVYCLGWHEQIEVAHVRQAMKDLMSNKHKVKEMWEAGMHLMGHESTLNEHPVVQLLSKK